MASAAYKNQGAIILWWDETEGTGASGEKADDFKHTLGEVVISPLVHPNVNGFPYASPVNFTHSSDLRTVQQISSVGPFLSDATLANDLSDLFAPGAIPAIP
jgi:phosphatidylinositol-3-phosphatase